MELIRVSNITKEYQPGRVALGPVSFNVSKPSIVGLIGPNGAGKTTLIRILSTQLEPTEGTASVLGFNILRDAEEIRKRIAVLPQDVGAEFYTMTVEDYLRIYSRIRGFSGQEARTIVKEAIRRFQLEGLCSKQVRELSGGQMRKALLAMILACPDVEIFFLDEPTTGLDPVIRHQIWDVLRAMVDEGRTIFLTSHHMDEIHSISDEVILLNEGKILAKDSPEAVIASVARAFPRKIILGEIPGWLQGRAKIYRVGRNLRVYPSDLEEVLEKLTHEKIDFEVSEIDMEDVFLLLGKE